MIKNPQKCMHTQFKFQKYEQLKLNQSSRKANTNLARYSRLKTPKPRSKNVQEQIDDPNWKKENIYEHTFKKITFSFQQTSN
jgi:hypothetical protein